tara:strand:+ start:5818 stop:7458 length:1641 start_codon:yes stop_codon:yes gene_type:complete
VSVPFRSEKQRRFLHATQPKLAQKWERKYGSKPVAVKKSVRDINPLTGEPLSMMRIQEFRHNPARGIPASRIPVPYSTIDYEGVVDPRFRFPVGRTIGSRSPDYQAALARAEAGDYPRMPEFQTYKFDRSMADNFGGYLTADGTVVEPERGLFFTPGNLQDMSTAVVTGTDEYAPARLVGVTSDPLSEGVQIRPSGAQQEDTNEVFVNRDIPGQDVFDLSPIYTRDRDYNPLWFGQGMSPEDAYYEEREGLTRRNVADRGQLQGLGKILNQNPALYHRPISKPLTFDERTFTNLADEAGVDPSIYRLPDESDQFTYADPGPMMDFLREKVNLRPMDRGYRRAMAARGMQPNFSQRTFGIPDAGFSQMPIDEYNVAGKRNLEVPPEFFDEDPEMGFARQGIDFDGIMERINALDMAKSDTSISSDSLASDMGYEPCSCCSPMQQASMALLDGYFEKAKKKSKPFHGYNPKRHHRKGGLNAAGRAKFKRETGANLKPPVTTKPSKLKPGSKRAKRRKSFCARMSGSKGPTSKDGKLTPKGAALKRWNC